MNEEEKKEIVEKKIEEAVETEPQKEDIPEEKKEEIKEEVKEEKVEETEPVKTPEEIIEELKKEIEVLTVELDGCKKQIAEIKPDEDVEKRVSGMQSKMQMKINDITKDFTDKLELKDKELSECKNQISDLTNKLETASKEFSTMKSALEEKENALATLNAGVNSNPKGKDDYKNLHGQAFFDWIKQNNIR